MSHLRRLIPYLRRYRARLTVGLLLALAGILCLALIPRVIQGALNRLETGDGTEEGLRRAALMIVALAAGRGVFQFIARVIVVGAGRHIEYDLRNDLFAKLLTLTPAYFHRMKTGDITSRMINDVENVRVLAGIGLLFAVGMGFLVSVCVVQLFLISPLLAVLTLVPLAVMGVLMWALSGRMHRMTTDVQEQLAKVSAFAQENFSGARVVRACAQEEAEAAAFDRLSADYADRGFRFARLFSLTWALLTVVMELGVVVTLYAGGRQIWAGALRLGDLTAFFSYQFMLIWPMIALGWVVNIVQRGSTCLERLGEILDERPEVADLLKSAETAENSPDARPKCDAPVSVSFRRLTFTYPGASRPSLDDVSLDLPSGSVTGVVGRTGSGKSTLVHLLLRLSPVPDGVLFIDDVEANRVPIADLRRRLGVVTQDAFLFSDTLRENIAFGGEDGFPVSGFPSPVYSQDPSASGNRKPGTGNREPETGNRLSVEDAARIAALTRDIEGFPEKFEQVIGERGVTLSGGQKQRVAIARAVLRNPGLLILDDAFSSVDTNTEQEILRGLTAFLKGRTTLLIAHRISTVRRADRIVVLDGGRIVDRGTHDELMSREGLYADLARRQQLTEELLKA